MTLISRNGSLVAGPFGLRQSYVPERGAPTAVSVTQRETDGLTYLDIVVEPVSGATSYNVTFINAATGTIVGSEHIDDAGPIGPIVAVESATRLLYQVTPNGGLAFQSSFVQQPPAAAITITTQPALVFNGGEVVGATVTVEPVDFTGGPLTGPTVYTLYTSNDDFVANRVEYAVYTGPLAAPAGWEGLKVRVEAPILGELGTVTAISAASGVITDDPSLPVPPQPIEQDWTIRAVAAPSPQEATHHVLEYELHNGPAAAVEVQWLGQPIENYQTPAEYEHLWEDTVANTTWWTQYRLGAQVVRPNGGTGNGNYRMRYKLDAAGPWSLASVDKKFAPTEPDEPAAEAQWHTLSLVTRETVAAGLAGGSQEQAPVMAERSKSDPSVIMFFQDTHGPWRSEDDGQTIFKPACRGLFAYCTISGAIDPEDDQVVLFAGSAQTTIVAESAAFTGIYRSTDAAENFDLVLTRPNMLFKSGRPHYFAYDASKLGTETPDTRTWWAILPSNTSDPNNGHVPWSLYKSTDGGQSWGSPIFTSTAATHGNVNCLVHHPTQSGVLYLCGDKGLFRSTNGGTSFTNLPIPGWQANGHNRVVSVEFNPAGGALGSTEMYICVGCYNTENTGATGIYRSTDGGGSMTELTVPGNPSRVVVATNSLGAWPAVGSRVLYLIGRGFPLRRSADGGANWTVPTVNHWPTAFGSAAVINDGAQGGIGASFNTEILPHPTNPNVVWACSVAKVYRSINAGAAFGPSGAYFEGQQYHTALKGLAFCEGNPATVTGADQVALVGVTDKGWWRTQNGGVSFHFTKIKYTGPLSKKFSCNLVTQCPDDIDMCIVTTGHQNEGCSYLRTGQKYPREFSDGHWDEMGLDVNWPYNGHWHRSNSAICYGQGAKFTAAKTGTARTNYHGGGWIVAVAPQDNNIIFTKLNTGASTQFRKSTDAGASSTLFVSPGWDPGRDSRQSVVAVDPGDHNILYMPGPRQGTDKDLRRFTAPSTWKTNYGFPARFRADNPDYPTSMGADVYWVAVDPQDRDTVAVSMFAPSYCAVYITYNATDATPTWTDITKNMQRLNPAKLQFHPYNGDLWAGFAGYGGALIYPHPDAHPYPTWTTNLIVQGVETA